MTAISGSYVVGEYQYSTTTNVWTFLNANNPNTFLIPIVASSVVTPPYLVEDIYLKGGIRVVANDAAMYALNTAVLKAGMLVVTVFRQ